jgi:hypothetical protein
MPIRSDGADGDVLAVLSVRKLFPSIPTSQRPVRPAGFSREEETFIRTLAHAIGPYLFIVTTAESARRRMESQVSMEERTQKVGESFSC